MKKTLFTLLALAPIVVFAGDDDQDKAPGRRRNPQRLMQRDKDGDGKLSPEELPNERMFRMLDKDGDGFVTSEELKNFRGMGRGKGRDRSDSADGGDFARSVLKQTDKDGDGKISKAEWPKQARHKFEDVDRNGDGFVDEKELTAAMSSRPDKSARPGGDRSGRDDPLKRLMQMDADKDGRISRDEWKGRKETFARIDKDKDGVLSKAELDALARNLRRRGGWKNRPAEALFRRMDKDGDKRISKEEWKMRPEMFAKFDANGDGFIVASEVMPRGGRKRARYDVRSGKDSASFLQRYDRNRDGSIDKTEFKHERRFAEIDADGNGVLSRDEVEQSLDKASSARSFDFIERFDLDRDGKVTRDEFTGPARVFESKDKNFDGVVDETDLPPKK